MFVDLHTRILTVYFLFPPPPQVVNKDATCSHQDLSVCVAMWYASLETTVEAAVVLLRRQVDLLLVSSQTHYTHRVISHLSFVAASTKWMRFLTGDDD